MPPSETLGLMLVRAGKITREQLYGALKAQRTSGKRLGDILFERGWIDEETLTFLLAKQMGIQFLDGRALDKIPDGLIAKIPAKLAREYSVVPVRVWKGKLHIALSDQKTLQYLDELSYFLGRTVQPHLVAPSALRAALEKYYSGAKAEAAPSKPTPPAPPAQPPRTSSDDFAEVQDRLNQRAAPKAQEPPVPEVDEEGRDYVNVKRPDGSDTKIFLLTDVLDPNEPTPLPVEEPEPEPTAEVEQPAREWPSDKTQIDIQGQSSDEHTPPEPDADFDGNLHSGFDIVKAAERIFSTQSPDDVAIILVAFARNLLDRTILFDARDKSHIRVWRHIDSKIDEGFLDSFTATTKELPLLRVVMEGATPFFGPAPASPIYGAFFERLGMDPPEQILLVPIRALGEVIAILYGDIHSGGREEDEFVDLQMLCKEAGTALDLLLSE